MKRILMFLMLIVISCVAFSQRPSKEQMEADRKKLAEAMKQLDEKTSKMNPEAKRKYDSMLNQFGVTQKKDDAIQQLNNNSTQVAKNSKTSVGLIPEKDTKAIASISNTPTNANMGAFIGTAGNGAAATILTPAKNKAAEIYSALKNKGTKTNEMGNAAAALWMSGKSQIALSLMAQVCRDDANNTDNLNNYAAMLTMTGSPQLAIPILNNLNARFKKNSTILNNLGQAWFALGDIDNATKYLDSTLMVFAAHPQANETMCLIDKSKGNKTAAIAHAKAAFKQGKTDTRADRLRELGYTPAAADYNNFPSINKSNDLLNLSGFAPPPFPKSVAECKALEPVWKQFRSDIDKRLQPLQKITDESNKAMTKRLQDQQQQFMNAMNKTIANPGSVSQTSALQIVGAPMFSEKMNAKENIVLQNLQRKRQAVIQKANEFINGDGAAMKKKYDDAMKKINDEWKNVGEGGTASLSSICIKSVKAANEFLMPYNSNLENLYNEYLVVEKSLLNEMSYSSLYTTYPELLPGINAGLQMQWLRDLGLKQTGFSFESVTKYDCADDLDGKNGRLTEFKDPKCDIHSEFGQSLGLANIGFSITLDCSGMTTKFNALAVGITLNQDLDHAGFGDSFKNCTVSIGPKVGGSVKAGPVEVSAKAGVGADIEIDKSGITDVVVTAGAEAEAGIGGPASASAGVEGRISLNSGAGSVGLK